MAETISGSVATSQRQAFSKLVDWLEPGDVLVVTKLDRLGRNAIDVGSTVAKLAGIGVRVHCLALGGVDLASSTGKLTMNVINAIAEFERDLLIERKRGWPEPKRRAGRLDAAQASALKKRPSCSSLLEKARRFRRLLGGTRLADKRSCGRKRPIRLYRVRDRADLPSCKYRRWAWAVRPPPRRINLRSARRPLGSWWHYSNPARAD